MEMERFKWKCKGRRSRNGGVGSGLGEGLQACQLPRGLGLGNALQLPKDDLASAFEHQRSVQFEGCAAEPLRTITAILPRSFWSCLLLRIVLQDALSEVVKIYPPLKLMFLRMASRHS